MKQNPFLITGYRSPEFFCDREKETDRLLDAFGNQRNITLISSRRMGKTGLILHAFNQASKDRSRVPVYFDIMGTTGLDEFAEVFSNAVIRAIARTEHALKGFLKKLSALRPGVSFDPLSGAPRISLDIRDERDVGLSLDLLFELIAGEKRTFITAIDEFQQIASYPSKNVEATLRSHIQQVSNMNFVFSGSKKHMLSDMFSQPSRPFFSSTEMMFLDRIEQDTYFGFIRRHFSASGKAIHDDALERIATLTGMHTFYAQFLCNRLFSAFRKVTADEVNETIRAILRENEPIYANYLNLMTLTQYRVLRAIAQDEEVENPTSGRFLAKHGLGAASTVSQAIESLTRKEFIQNESGRLTLQDKFLAQWIRSK